MTRPEWKQFICRACGLIYDEQAGDPDSGIAPGTRFEDIPDDWVCPLCGVVKSDFEPYDLETVPCQPSASAQVGYARSGSGVVIVGGGHAGWSAAQALRSLDPAIPITLVTACSGDRYLKPELSIALSRGATRASLVREPGDQAARKLNVALISDTFVVGLSPALHQLRTTRGTLSYLSLILAQGARPALPPVLPSNLCWRINDLDAWAGLQKKLQDTHKRILIVGAGLVGCELADDFARAGHQVTLLDIQALPLASLLPDKAANRLRDQFELAGIQFAGEVIVAGVTQNKDGEKLVTTQCGRSFKVDEVVAATGLVTDARLAQGAGLRFDRGIAVDATTMRTSVADVYALGDCVSLDGAPCRFIEPIGKQAETIAHEILHRSHPGYGHKPPVIRVKTKSLPIVLHGSPSQSLPWTTREESPELLVMEQIQNGEILSRLEVGSMAGRKLKQSPVA